MKIVARVMSIITFITAFAFKYSGDMDNAIFTMGLSIFLLIIATEDK